MFSVWSWRPRNKYKNTFKCFVQGLVCTTLELNGNNIISFSLTITTGLYFFLPTLPAAHAITLHCLLGKLNCIISCRVSVILNILTILVKLKISLGTSLLTSKFFFFVMLIPGIPFAPAH